jgi:hypothetical protein
MGAQLTFGEDVKLQQGKGSSKEKREEHETAGYKVRNEKPAISV